jgi:hypothetical protein
MTLKLSSGICECPCGSFYIRLQNMYGVYIRPEGNIEFLKSAKRKWVRRVK